MNRRARRRGVWLTLAGAAALLVWAWIGHTRNPLEPLHWAWVLGFIALGAAVALGQIRRPLLQHLFFSRFSLLFGLFLAVFPLATLNSALFSNLFVLRSPMALGLIALLAVLHAWVVLVTAIQAAQLAPVRFRVPPFDPPGWLARLVWSRWSFSLALLLAAPMVLTAWIRSPLGTLASAVAVAAGAAAATVIVVLVVGLRRRLLPSSEPGSFLVHEVRASEIREERRGVQPFLDRVAGWLCRWLSPYFLEGYVYQDRQGRSRLYRGHLFNLLLLAATYLVHVVFYWRTDPGDGPFDTLPALGYLLLLLIALTWLFSGASFLLDRYRFPTLLAVAAVSFFSFFVSDTDHYYDTVPRVPDGRRLGPVEALDAWYDLRARPGGEPPVLVAVTAVGGGITTAVWTDHVLLRLSREVGRDLIGSIGLISAVSGGSVGTLHVMDALTARDGGSVDERLETAYKAALEPSLAEAAWGLTYPDLWRGVPGEWFRSKNAGDRGEALELAWRRKLKGAGARLSHWRAGVAAGWLPAPIFNTTINETGGRLLLTPLDLPATRWRAHNFFQLYPEFDIGVATAARLSASFPYVSPISRPELPPRRGKPDRRGFHLADGGYYDNYGVSTLVDWLKEVKPAFQGKGGRKILIVQIRDVPAVEPAAARRVGWTNSLVGPLRTLVQIRTATQANRNELEIELMQRLACGDKPAERVQIASVIFSLEPGVLAEPSLPLSWQMTQEEENILKGRWLTARNRAALACARAFFRGGDTAAVCGGGALVSCP